MVTLMLAVNDYRGNPAWRIERVNLRGDGDTTMDLSAGIWPPSRCPKFTRGDGWIRISRRKFAVGSYTTWVGNWCWDAVRITFPVAVEIVTYLRDLKWHMEGGDCRLGELWESGRKFRLSDIAAACMTAEELAGRKAKRTEEMTRA